MRVNAVLALSLLVIASFVPATAATPPPIFVGGAFIRQHALEDARGHLLVPVRGVFEALHADVTYTPPRYVVVRKDGAVIAGLIVGRRDAVVENRPRVLLVAPLRRNGRLYVPLRMIAEIAGASVEYSAKPRYVNIRLPNQDLSVRPSTGRVTETPPATGIPPWSYALVGAALLGLLMEMGRQLAVVARKPARRALGPGFLPLSARPLQLPYSGVAGDQNGVRQVIK